jgi:hypothetical protein
MPINYYAQDPELVERIHLLEPEQVNRLPSLIWSQLVNRGYAETGYSNHITIHAAACPFHHYGWIPTVDALQVYIYQPDDHQADWHQFPGLNTTN